MYRYNNSDYRKVFRSVRRATTLIINYYNKQCRYHLCTWLYRFQVKLQANSEFIRKRRNYRPSDHRNDTLIPYSRSYTSSSFYRPSSSKDTSMSYAFQTCRCTQYNEQNSNNYFRQRRNFASCSLRDTKDNNTRCLYPPMCYRKWTTLSSKKTTRTRKGERVCEVIVWIRNIGGLLALSFEHKLHKFRKFYLLGPYCSIWFTPSVVALWGYSCVFRGFSSFLGTLFQVVIMGSNFTFLRKYLCIGRALITTSPRVRFLVPRFFLRFTIRRCISMLRRLNLTQITRWFFRDVTHVTPSIFPTPLLSNVYRLNRSFQLRRQISAARNSIYGIINGSFFRGLFHARPIPTISIPQLQVITAKAAIKTSNDVGNNPRTQAICYNVFWGIRGEGRRWKVGGWGLGVTNEGLGVGRWGLGIGRWG